MLRSLLSHFELMTDPLLVGVEDGKPLSQDYINTNLANIEKQIVLGGHRLATVIKTVFGSNSANAFLQ